MDIKNMRKTASYFLIIALGFSSTIYAEGSLLVYNYSFYQARIILYTQTTDQSASGTYSNPAGTLESAPMSDDGSLKMHPVSESYVEGSNVPLGSVGEIEFCEEGGVDQEPINGCTAKHYLLQILKDGSVVGGLTLPTQGDNDPDRVVYVYSNMNAEGIYVPNVGGSVYLWDAQYPLNDPSIQTFYDTKDENHANGSCTQCQ